MPTMAWCFILGILCITTRANYLALFSRTCTIFIAVRLSCLTPAPAPAERSQSGMVLPLLPNRPFASSLHAPVFRFHCLQVNTLPLSSDAASGTSALTAHSEVISPSSILQSASPSCRFSIYHRQPWTIFEIGTSYLSYLLREFVNFLSPRTVSPLNTPTVPPPHSGRLSSTLILCNGRSI